MWASDSTAERCADKQCTSVLGILRALYCNQQEEHHRCDVCRSGGRGTGVHTNVKPADPHLWADGEGC